MAAHLSRREMLNLLAAGAAGLAVPGAAQAAPLDEGLGTIAARAGILFGAAIDDPYKTDPAYRRLYLKECQVITTANAMKFDHLRWTSENADFERADNTLDFAEKNGLLVRGHTLVWNDYPAPWLKSRSHAELRRIFDAHLDEVVARYAGRLFCWDVVNEPLWPGHGNAGAFRSGPWYKAFGPAYVERAFRRVAAIDKDAKLVLNESGTEHQTGLNLVFRKNLLRLIDTLLDAGAPLHAVGLEGHLSAGRVYDGAAFTDFLWQIAERGLEIHVTELDVDDRAIPGTVKDRDKSVADMYSRHLTSVLKVPAVKMLVVWGFSDKFSWRFEEAAEEGRRLPRPLLFDNEYRRKPAWHAVARALAGRRS